MRGVLVCFILFLLLVSTPRNPILPEPPTVIAEVLMDSVATALFDEAVECIKQHEGWHGSKQFPYVGYGHKLLPRESFTAEISVEIADSLLRADLLQKCSTFRAFGKDSLILGVLAYNVGEYRLLGLGSMPKSNLIRKLENGDRDIYEEYISFRRYRGKVIPSIENRRKAEYELLFDKTFLTMKYDGN